MKHVMIDLETMDNIPTASIISIGAVTFGLEKGNWVVDKSNTFYTPVNLQSCVNVGLTVGASTSEWWDKQSEEAKEVLKIARSSETIQIFGALNDLYNWFKKSGGVYPWGNGADFDIAILNNAYNKVYNEIGTPWAFWNSRCFRTIKNITDVKADKFEGVKHNALADAIFQAEHACKILNSMGIK